MTDLNEKALEAAGWEETFSLGRIGSEAAEVAIAAYFGALVEQGIVLVDLREVAEALDRGPHGLKSRHEFARYIEARFAPEEKP